jgi:hypothetical protein
MGSNRLDDPAVQVLVDGTWRDGWLDPDDWRKDGDRWVATVRYQPEPHSSAIDAFDQDEIRKM